MNRQPAISDKMITLKKDDYGRIIEYAVQQLPDEACGLIAGIVDSDGGKRIEKVYFLTNKDNSSEHFSMDPREQLEAVRDMRANGFQPLGNWHSHPGTPSRPSDEDKRLAYDSKASYLILSLAERENPVLNSFHIEGTNSNKEDLIIV